MASRVKHKRNHVLEWFEAEESDIPASPRSRRVVSALTKAQKPVPKKRKLLLPSQPPPKPDPALAR